MPKSTSSVRLAASQSALAEQLTTLLDTVIDGIVVIDDRGVILSFNKAAERIFGYTAHEAIGRNVSFLMPEPNRSRHDGYLKRYIETGEARIVGIGREVVGLRKDGSQVPLDLAVSQMWIEGGRFFTGILRDISDRKRAEVELARKNQLLQDRNRLDQIENSVARIFSRREPLEESLQQVLTVLHESLGAPVSGVWTYDEWSGLLKCVASHAAPANLQRSFRFGEGIVGQVAEDQRITVLSNAPITIDTGLAKIEPSAVVAAPLLYQERLLGVLTIAFLEPLQDRERLFVERLSKQLGTSLYNLRQYEDLLELSQQLNDRSREISRQNRELERANRLKSEFLANMSHELRTPLNAIIGFSEVLKDQLLGKLNEEQLDYTGEIFTAGRHLLELINEILDLAKIEAGKMELHLASIHPSQLMDSAVAVVREQALNKRIQLDVLVDPDLPEVFLDVRKTRQILFNLLANAVKFTLKGGRVTLSCKRQSSGDRESEWSQDEMVIAVRDTGIGIAESDLDRLFRPFVQVDGSMSRRFEGTGLGLAMVEKLTALHGGRVNVESQVGKGTTFTVFLPWRDSPRDSRTHSPLPFTAAELPLILLAASSGEATSRVNGMLESAGYRVQVTHPDSMIDACRNAHPDVVVLEVTGSPDSLELLGEMRSALGESVPVVLLTVDEQAERGLSLGAAEVLTKPVEAGQLLGAIRVLGLQSEPMEGSRVLVVDDDPRAVDLVSRQLEDAGLTVTRAFGGAEAIELVKEGPDLVILDLMMPEVSGLDVIESMQRHPKTEAIPIIVLTARVLEATERRQLALSVAKVLEKRTFHADHLLQEVRRALQARKSSSPGSSPSPVSLQAETTPFIRAASLRAASQAPEHDDRSVPSDLVLVVESRMTDRRLLRIYLEDEGLRVESAKDSDEAIALLEDGVRPAMVVVDLASPVVDGYELLSWLSSHKDLASIPVVATTAHTESVTDTPAVTAFLSKPIGRQPLLEVVTTLLKETSGQSLLVVDDNPNAVSLLNSYLESAGIETTVAYSGEDALRSIASTPPDLVLLDLMMPGMSGFEVLDALRENPETRSIPVIIVTARVLSQDERNRLLEQADAINEKGELKRSQLIEQVRTLLEERR